VKFGPPSHRLQIFESIYLILVSATRGLEKKRAKRRDDEERREKEEEERITDPREKGRDKINERGSTTGEITS